MSSDPINVMHREHPTQPFTLRYYADENLITFTGMALADEAMTSLIQTAFEAIKTDKATPIRVYFYSVPFADDEVLMNIHEKLTDRFALDKLQFYWFYDAQSEKEFGIEWSQKVAIPFQFIDTEPSEKVRELIRKYNEKAAQSGLYYRLESNLNHPILTILASQNPFFHYRDFEFTFYEVRYCNLMNEQRWTDDYSLQWILIEWEEALEFCMKNRLILHPGEIIIRWLIHPLEKETGYILCKDVSIHTQWW